MDPSHYYTIPGLSWDAMLKMTKIELEIVKDIDIIMFIEKGIRGGLTQCSKRYAEANNKYMNTYDKNKSSTFLMYYDINAMYSWAMMQYLPYKDIKWVDDVDNLNFNVSDDNEIGYILEVDLEYPEKLHDNYSDLPMAPEQMIPPNSKESKMLGTLFNKEKYVLHYRNLKQYLTEGLILTKIHRAIKFDQKDWLKLYIDLNSKLRQQAKNDFEKDSFKLMNNAVFGKTMENVRLRRDIKLVSKWDGRYGTGVLLAKPNFHRYTIFETTDDFIGIEMLKTSIRMEKPIYVGMSILDVSKTLLYDFHYKHMKNYYNEECKLLYTDTDSLIYEIHTQDVYADMKINIHKFDTSGYEVNNSYNIPRINNKVVGVMKDENNGKELINSYIF